MDRGNLLLVHGAWHGSWCWDLLVPELRSRGWTTSVLDLPSASGAPAAGVREDAEVVRAAIGALDGPVTVLAHSYAGVPVGEAAQAADRLVYLAAHLLEPGESVVSPLGGPWYEPGTKLLDVPEPARDLLFADVPDERAAWAAARLRPQSARSFEEPVTAAAWRTVPTTSILCADDVIFPAPFADRLRARGALRLPGSHSPFLSRPAELADLITAG
ncbi:alpha/beta fold hydrolase [Lentzea flaviverrucosa]|uniref:Alpha/beta hydrolase family protein n=1 Tax=Lentzea flaviverrucosa TaxID=200379 RepID=A0A1H9WER1_9PSEU|nr:alpha/beta fold hydrolase [Lentzea flaviverrucosa]RDI22148.1 alpha/beta hydrolase family protein [Lentzea flaviverrucosa]SES32426.1 Alpha/beta hydrolase family protein [Lentzea flaviverrucosa]